MVRINYIEGPDLLEGGCETNIEKVLGDVKKNNFLTQDAKVE